MKPSVGIAHIEVRASGLGQGANQDHPADHRRRDAGEVEDSVDHRFVSRRHDNGRAGHAA